jgi:AP2 domain
MKMIPIRSDIRTAMVDDEDFDHLSQYRWFMAGGKGGRGKYAARREGRTTIYLHREVAFRMGLIDALAGNGGGHWTMSVDHANGDRLDNRRANLSMKNRSQQMRNRADALRSTNHSGYRGVTFDRARGKWAARVTVNYRMLNLGRFATAEEAHQARLRWEAQ